MKYILALMLICTTVPASAAEKSCEKSQAVAIVDGMVCDFCVQSLKKVLGGEPGVQDVEINLTTKEVSILLKPGQTIDDATITKKVDWAGYKVAEIKRSCLKAD